MKTWFWCVDTGDHFIISEADLIKSLVGIKKSAIAEAQESSANRVLALSKNEEFPHNALCLVASLGVGVGTLDHAQCIKARSGIRFPLGKLSVLPGIGVSVGLYHLRWTETDSTFDLIYTRCVGIEGAAFLGLSTLECRSRDGFERVRFSGPMIGFRVGVNLGFNSVISFDP